MKTIVVASGNEGKVKQIKSFLASYDVKSMKDFKINDPVENGITYAQNALIKARNVFEKCKIPTLADDSGFEIEALNGFPGLVSGRFADACGGYEKTFSILNECLTENKNARFCTVVAFVFEKDGKMHEKVFEGSINGKFVYPPKGDNGFGYCPCFMPDGYNETFAQIPDQVREEINHRSIALRKFADFMRDFSF